MRRQQPLDIKAPAESLLISGNKEAAVVQKKATRAKKEPHSEDSLHVQALHSLPAFAELIKYHGGWESFGDCHTDLATFVTTPQREKEAIKIFKMTGDEAALGLRRLTLMPRGHLKSTINTTLYTMWRLYRNPEIRIFVGTDTKGLSHSFIRELRQYFENQDLQKRVWNARPHFKGNLIPELNSRARQRNQNQEYENTETVDKKLIWNNNALQVIRDGNFKEPSITAGSSGSTETGQHYDLVIMDDVIDFDNVQSEVKKQKTEEWIADLESVINPPMVVTLPMIGEEILGGEFVINGTRYAVDDYYAQLLENLEELEYIAHLRNIYINGVDDSDGYLWGARYNKHTIQRILARTSPRRFASQYLNKVYDKDVALLDVKACEVLPHRNFSVRGDLCYFDYDGVVYQVNPIIAVDPAFSAGKNGDDCAIAVGFKLPNGKLVVVDAALDSMDAAEVVKHCMRFGETYRTLRLFSEANGVGMLVPELFKTEGTLVRGKRFVVTPHYEQRPKEAKIQGVLELPFALGQMVFTDNVFSNERIHKQMSLYPAVRHDDFLDALVTLYEKAVASRTHTKTSVNRDLRYSLNIDYVIDKRISEPKQTLLGAYGGDYR